MKLLFIILSFATALSYADDTRANINQRCPEMLNNYDSCNGDLQCENKISIKCTMKISGLNQQTNAKTQN